MDRVERAGTQIAMCWCGTAKVLCGHEAALPNPVSDTRDLGIQGEREACARTAEQCFGEQPGIWFQEAREYIAKAIRARTSTTIELDTVDGREAAEKLASEHIPEIGDAFTSLEDRLEAVSSLADAILALSPASTDERTVAEHVTVGDRLDIGALREARFLIARIDELDWCGTFEDFIREWNGHVDPPLCRLRQALSANGIASPVTEA